MHVWGWTGEQLQRSARRTLSVLRTQRGPHGHLASQKRRAVVHSVKSPEFEDRRMGWTPMLFCVFQHRLGDLPVRTEPGNAGRWWLRTGRRRGASHLLRLCQRVRRGVQGHGG
ncbi:hypothetical protein CDN98_14960 [Roseateles terrae]|nr:hypothetical protein CDN98_14960 [Roseateles terrae]